MACYHACKCPTPIRWSRRNAAVSDEIGRVARGSSTRDYLFEGVKECVILLWVVEEKSDGERVVRRTGTGGSLVPVRHRSGARPRCGAVRPKDRIGLGFVDAGRHSTRRRERHGAEEGEPNRRTEDDARTQRTSRGGRIEVNAPARRGNRETTS